jgi:hypothetical protein
MYAIKIHIADPRASHWVWRDQKTMYGGKHLAAGDTLFVFDSENEGGCGLMAIGQVTRVTPTPANLALERQTPRISIDVQRTGSAKARLGRLELRSCTAWADGRPQTELNFKFYRQATNKIIGLSDAASAFLMGYF